MRPGLAIHTVGALLLVAFLPCAAQQLPEQRWHFYGTLGLNLTKTTNTPLQQTPGSEYSTAAGDLRLTANGFLKDPRLLPFTLDFAGERGSNSIDTGGFRDTILSWGVNTIFLPQRPFPLRFYYRKSSFGSRGNAFGEDTDNSALGLDWTLKLPKLPHVNVSFGRFANKFRLVKSLSDVSYRDQDFRIGVEHTWKRWECGITFDKYLSTSNSIGLFSLPGDFQAKSQTLGGRLRRLFWEGKGDFNLDSRFQWRKDRFPTGQSSDTSDTFTNANLRLQHSPKLSSNYFYRLSRMEIRTTVLGGALPGLPGDLIVIQPPAFLTHFAGGRLDYRPAKFLWLFQEIRYYHRRPPDTTFEVSRSVTEALPGASVMKIWHGLELEATYTGHVQLMGTNLGNRTHTLSNEAEGRLGWGDARHVRLLATARYGKLNLVDQLGGFSRDRRLRLEAETSRLHRLVLRFTAEHTSTELLNLSGDTRFDATNLGLHLDHRRISLGIVRTLGEGAGALFPEDVRRRQLITIPLPLGVLFFTPLLDRTTRTTAAFLVLRLRRNLDLSGNWRLERNVFSTSTQRFRQAELLARYRLGKFTFESGFSNYRTEVLAAPRLTGTNINRYLLRVARDFMVF